MGNAYKRRHEVEKEIENMLAQPKTAIAAAS